MFFSYVREKTPLMQESKLRKMEKYFENLHAKGKPSFLDYPDSLDKQDPGIVGPSTISIGNQSGSNSLDKQDPGIIGPSTISIGNQSGSNSLDKQDPGIVGPSTISIGNQSGSNSLDKQDPRIIEPSTISIGNQSSSNNGNGNYVGANSQSGMGKRRREEDGIIPRSSSTTSLVGGGNQDEQIQNPKPPRMKWTIELQHRFNDAFEALGETRATPSRIKELMDEPLLTQQHISSYLQKYRSRLKAPVEELTKPGMEKSNDGSVPRAKTRRDRFPTLSLNLSPAPYQFPRQVNTPWSNLVPGGVLNSYGTSGNLLRNPNLYDFRATTSNHFANIFGQRTHEYAFPGLQIREPNSATGAFQNNANNSANIFGQRIQGNAFPGLQPRERNSATGAFQNNVGFRQFLPERRHVLLQDLNRGFAREEDDIGARESVPRENGIAGMQEGNGGIGFLRNNILMPQEPIPEDINNIYQHFPGNDVSSPDGNVSAASVTQPLRYHIGTATGEERDADETFSEDETPSEDAVEEDMEKFLNMDKFSANSDGDDGFINP